MLLTLAACSDQSEGDRCQVENGDDDCKGNGLVCLPASKVNPPFDNQGKSARCCPEDRRTATHPACTELTSSITGDSAPPPNTGPTADAALSDANKDGG